MVNYMATALVVSMLLGVLLSLLVGLGFLSLMVWRYGQLMLTERRKFNVATFCIQIVVIAILMAAISYMTYRDHVMADVVAFFNGIL